VGARKGERLYEPLWLEEENPTATEYAKILQLKNLPYESNRLNSLIEKLKPICFYDDSAPELFRNKEELLKLLCDDVPTLKEFYESLKTEEQLRTDIL
jgi:FlaA1/EpsC-like NDP-sugar epimerase